MAASNGHGRLWGEAYSVTPGGIYVPRDSDIRSPEDLAGVPITVAFQSGSHYSTIQSLEPFIERDQIKLHFGGMLFQRLELFIDGEVPAANLFGGPMYFAEQLGYRKIIDTSFMIAAMISDQVETDDVPQNATAPSSARKPTSICSSRSTSIIIATSFRPASETSSTRACSGPANASCSIPIPAKCSR